VAGPTVAANNNLIIAAAARYKLPAVYIQRPIVAAGRVGLLWAEFR